MFLSQAFSERSGKPSSHRLMMGLACATILGVWAAVSIERKELQPLSVEQMGIVLGAMGTQAWKRGREDNKQQQQEPTNTKATI